MRENMVSGSGHQFDPDQPRQFRTSSSAPVIVVIFDQRCPLAIFNPLRHSAMILRIMKGDVHQVPKNV
jgi:PII-like signaling protein